MNTMLRTFSDSLAWNVLLLVMGAFVYVVGYNGIAAQQDFIPGGLYGLAVVTERTLPLLSLPLWYFVLNLPLFLIAWRSVSKRFFFLNLFTMSTVSLLTATIHPDLGIHNEIYAALASGAIMGAGCGIILRTYGGGGGMDVLAIILNRKYGVRFGVFFFAVNAAVMSFALARFTPDKIIASLLMLFVTSVVTEYVLSLFNQRKAVRIITRKPAEMVEFMTKEKKLHATIIPAKGGYSGSDLGMIYSITDNLRLRTMEQIVFDIDPQAIFVVENTFSVLGGSIAKRKIY